MSKKLKKIHPEWTLVRDTREQMPWTFENVTIGTGSAERRLELKIKDDTLKSGDYSIEGFEHRVAIERKSKEDLFNTLGRGRARFIRELERLSEMEFAAVVVECSWIDAMTEPPLRSRLTPASLNGMYISWMLRYRNVHWVWIPGRYTASKVAYKILDRFYKDITDGEKDRQVDGLQRTDEEACEVGDRGEGTSRS